MKKLTTKQLHIQYRKYLKAGGQLVFSTWSKLPLKKNYE